MTEIRANHASKKNENKTKSNQLTGTNANDIILGTALVDFINGNKGDDFIFAGAGDDFIHGNEGNDVIEGGTGNDKIYGNAGSDRAVFNGSILDYSWAVNQYSNGSGNNDWHEGEVAIVDLNTADSDDGVDTLVQIENLQFKDLILDITGNNAPLVIAADLHTDEDTPVTFALPVFDFDGDTVSVISAISANGADITETGSSSLTAHMGTGTEFTINYDPGSLFQYLAAGETTNDQVTIEVSDGNGGITTKIININITGVNDNPLPNPDDQKKDNGIALHIDFEDLKGSGEIPIPDNYHGFDWHVPGNNLYVLDSSNYSTSGYQVAGTEVAYTPSALDPLVITRHDQGLFIFEGVELTSAWESSQNITLEGWLNGMLVYSENAIIYNTVVTMINISGEIIDTLVIDNMQDNGNDHLILDDFYFTIM